MTDRTKSKKSRHPATSARILATGVTATAVLGLTSALAMAKPNWENTTSTSTAGAVTPIGDAILGSDLSTGSTNATPAEWNTSPQPAPTSSQTTAKAAPATNTGKKKKVAPPTTQATVATPTTQAPVVVTVPAPPSNGGNTGTPSKSNGS